MSEKNPTRPVLASWPPLRSSMAPSRARPLTNTGSAHAATMGPPAATYTARHSKNRLSIDRVLRESDELQEVSQRPGRSPRKTDCAGRVKGAGDGCVTRRSRLGYESAV